MASKLYGSVSNRMEENKMLVDKIEVGTLVTEYLWSDRHPFEVIAVKDQKHVTIREMGHRHVGDGEMDNNWELYSKPSSPSVDVARRGEKWYIVLTATLEDLESGDFDKLMWISQNGFDEAKIREKGSQTKYTPISLTFGVGEYYYDYEF